MRQFPNVAREFNLTRAELFTRIVTPWTEGTPVKVDDRRWAPDRARLTIYEGPELRTEELGLGRGWANVTRAGDDVTARVLAEGSAPETLERFKEELLERSAQAPMTLRRVVELAGERYPQARASERLGLAEQAVWELLHRRLAGLEVAGRAVPQDQWREAVLRFSTWVETDEGALRLRALE